MRPDRVIAIAQRDLAQELKGRRGWVLPAIMAGLLLPVSGAPLPSVQRGMQAPRVTVSGEVPPEVVALEEVELIPEGGSLLFSRAPGGPLVLSGSSIPAAVRDTLDAGEPTVTLHPVTRTIRVPNRSLLFALISASTLTGAISASIAGERTHRTLGTLLTAAITRAELVAGKVMAWGGLGALTSLIAAAVSIALGRLEAGWWLLPLPTVSIATVALGLFLVRRASDLVGGTTVTLRVLPAVLAGTGIASTLVGMSYPVVGAAIPLGGALLTAGSTWGGSPSLAILSAASTLALTGVCLFFTARDLEEHPGRSGRQPWSAAVLGATLMAGALWWIPFGMPTLWGVAGNTTLATQLPIRASAIAGLLGLGLMIGVQASRARDPIVALSLHRPRTPLWGWIAVVGVALACAAASSQLLPLPESPALARVRLRLADGLLPLWAGPTWVILSILVHELLFRGWIQRIGGPVVSVLAWTAVMTPLDPLHGLLTGSLLAALTVRAGGSVWPAIGAHTAWAVVVFTTPAVPAIPGLALGACTLALLVISTQRQSA